MRTFVCTNGHTEPNRAQGEDADPINAVINATASTHGLALATLNLTCCPMLEDLQRPYES